MPHLFCFGLGYTALHLARNLLREGWAVTGTCRSEENAAALQGEGFEAVIFDGGAPVPTAVLEAATHIVSSVPPERGEGADPVLACHGTTLARSPASWIGYLSSTGIYGDRGGALVDETAPIVPSSDRARRRAAAEAGWLTLAGEHSRPVHIFRLAGIYGPGRSPLDQIRSGRAQRIDKPGQFFSRIHVADIASAIEASISRPDPGRIYNLADDEPASSADVLAYGARLLGVPEPPLVPFEEAVLSPMAAAFYADNRRIDNGRMKRELGVRLAYPDYRCGLRSLL